MCAAPGLKELGRGEIAERLVGPDVVVGMLPGAQFAPEAGHGRGGIRAVVELFFVGPVRPFDSAVELWAMRWQDEEQDSARFTGSLEVGHELGAAIDLDGANREGCTRHEVAERAFGESAVAREAIIGTDQRLTTSTVVNCLRMTPGSGRISVVSIWTRSPGARGRYSRGFRVA